MGKENFENKRRLAFSVVLNVAITISEAIAGIFTGSLALISDAGHNFSDVLSLILGYAGASISGRGATEELTYGYRRAEVITSLVNASVLFVIGIYIIFEAYKRFLNPAPVGPIWMIAVGGVALAGNVGSIFILEGGERKSLNIRAVILHLVFDSLASVGVIAGGILIFLYDIYFADIAISILISVLIFWSASDVLKKGLHIIMQGTPSDIEFEEVRNLLLGFEEVSSIHDLHIWSLSSEEKVLSCHLCPTSRKRNTDELIQKIESRLQEKFDIRHVTIQIESEEVCKTGNRFF